MIASIPFPDSLFTVTRFFVLPRLPLCTSVVPGFCPQHSYVVRLSNVNSVNSSFCYDYGRQVHLSTAI
jgi:hypothetical protein